MKIRLIQTNSGAFEFEWFDEKHYQRWERINYLSFQKEEDARKCLLGIMKFQNAKEINRIVEELEFPQNPPQLVY